MKSGIHPLTIHHSPFPTLSCENKKPWPKGKGLSVIIIVGPKNAGQFNKI